MTPEEFNRLIFEPTVEKMRELSRVKGGEYSGDADRLANFKRNAAALGLDPLQVWAVYAAKHWDSLMTYLQDIQTNTMRPRTESIEGRADDLLVYLMLFKGLLHDGGKK
jgi:hypothetical protein